MSRSEGVWGEALVADYLREKGYKLAAHSYHCRFGEIDLIAWDKSVLCFVEVKTRTNTQMGLPGNTSPPANRPVSEKPRSFTSATMALTAPPALMWPRSTPPRPGMKKASVSCTWRMPFSDRNWKENRKKTGEQPACAAVRKEYFCDGNTEYTVF